MPLNIPGGARLVVLGFVRCNAMLAGSLYDADRDTSAFAVALESPVHGLRALGESRKYLRTSQLKRVRVYEIDPQLFIGREMEGGHPSGRRCQARHAVDPRVPVLAVEPRKAHHRSELAMQR